VAYGLPSLDLAGLVQQFASWIQGVAQGSLSEGETTLGLFNGYAPHHRPTAYVSLDTAGGCRLDSPEFERIRIPFTGYSKGSWVVRELHIAVLTEGSCNHVLITDCVVCWIMECENDFCGRKPDTRVDVGALENTHRSSTDMTQLMRNSAVIVQFGFVEILQR
jgi:hypothetical protein